MKARKIYNKVPEAEKELIELFDVINMVLEHIKKGVFFRRHERDRHPPLFPLKNKKGKARPST